MSSTLEQPGIGADHPQPEHSPADQPHPAVLIDRMPDSWKMPRVVIGYVILLGAFFWSLSFQPLYHTDLWGHMSYGKLLWETHVFPTSEPLMPLSAGVPFVDTAWLSQVIGYAAYRQWGLAALQFLHASMIVGCFAILARMFYHKTRNAYAGLVGLGVFAALNWHQFLVVRPQLAGLLCCVMLIAMLAGRRWRTSNWFVIPTLFALWANLHGSFVVGLMLLGCCTAGRAIDVWRRTRTCKSILHDGITRRFFLLTELAIAATLVNPYGWALWTDVFTVSGNANLMDLIEWQPMQIRSLQGEMTAAVALLLMFVYRLSPRRISAIEILALVTFGLSALWTSRMLIWWSPLAAVAIVWHGHAAWLKAREGMPLPGPSPRSSRSTFIVAALVWIFVGYTPFAMVVLHKKQIEVKNAVSDATPIAAVEFLNKHPVKGQIFNTYEWGDYLQWAGPKGLKVFVNSHAHLVPREIWKHYISVINASSDYEDILDRTGVNLVFVDKQERGALISRLKVNDQWKRTYEDGLAVIYVRKKPI